MAFLTALLAIDDMVEYVRSEEAYGLFYIARDKDGDMELGHALFTSAQETFQLVGVNG